MPLNWKKDETYYVLAIKNLKSSKTKRINMLACKKFWHNLQNFLLSTKKFNKEFQFPTLRTVFTWLSIIYSHQKRKIRPK